MVDSLLAPQEQLKLMRQHYLEQLPEKLDRIEATWSRFLETAWDIALLETLHCLVHRLVGSSATFGATLLSDRARTLEDCLKAVIESGNSPTLEERHQITALLARLKQVEIQPEPEPVCDRDRLDEPIAAERISLGEPDNRLIFLVEDDLHLAENLMLQLSYFGYTVRRFERLDGLAEMVMEMPPAAVVMDIMFPEGTLAGTQVVTEIQRTFGRLLPVMFISARGDLNARLQAVRAGGAAYLTKPIDIGELLDKLDALAAPYPPESYRVLIVEDDAPLAAYYASILEQAGIATSVVTNPLHVMQPLVEFTPDLILIDVYMPHCNGLELAAVIRQQEAYLSIPIVFLSSETNINKQLAAMSLGGDDFLTKPIQPDYLIDSVLPRLERSRSLRSLMVRDSLTGLLNHSKIKEQLGIEVKRAKRQNSTFAFAMIDIDHFKSVNDTYGHLTGDRAIKSLSRLLQQRLRKTDTIGRYGGEEFAVILPDTDNVTAKRVLNEIREGFSQLRQQAEGVEFSLTFSCGIAAFPQYGDAAKLNNSADKALYRAKHQGRNQIVLATEL